MDFLPRYTILKNECEQYFECCFNDIPAGRLAEAMRYSLLAGGKRLRPILTMAFCEACGGKAEEALEIGCAIEILHTYSLIHDDLPCMDNDDLRRGKPTNHKVYGECTAVLAGDAMQAEAFRIMLLSSIDAERRLACAGELAIAAGPYGICSGQQFDMEAETVPPDEDGLRLIEKYKTAALIDACCRCGVIVAGGDDTLLKAASEYAFYVGLAFQIEDDILDILSNPEVLGKNTGSDEARNKPTFASVMGIDKAREKVNEYTLCAIKAAEKFPNSGFIIDLAGMLAGRKY